MNMFPASTVLLYHNSVSITVLQPLAIINMTRYVMFTSDGVSVSTLCYYVVNSSCVWSVKYLMRAATRCVEL